MKPDRFELPECRNKALLLATDAIEAGTGDVRDEALQWFDCALSDALADLCRYKATLEEIGPNCFGHLLMGRVPIECCCAGCLVRQALADDEDECKT